MVAVAACAALGVSPVSAERMTWDASRWDSHWCTAFAAERIHATTGSWPYIPGPARDWAVNAQANGWPVGAAPRESSVLVLQPGWYKAHTPGGYRVIEVGDLGHVAWVQFINDDGTIAVLDRNGVAGPGKDGQMMIDIRGTSAQFIYVEP